MLAISLTGKARSQQLTQPTNNSTTYPRYDYRQRMTVDSEIDPGSIATQIKNELIDFVVDKLEAETFLTQLNQDIATITGDVQTVLDDYGIPISRGKVGLPNVQEAKIIFAESKDLSSLSDIFSGQTGATYGNRNKLYQQFLGQLSEEYTNNSALSLEGQSKLQAKVDSAISSAQQSLTIAENSSKQDVSQNIMRNVSNQLALSQQATAMEITDMQSAQIARSLDLQTQSQILEELSGGNTRDLRETVSTSGANISALGLVTIPGLTEVAK